ncbi:hypothetical protein GWO43_28330 [candidate division KSB1 bacterium]|nr:hypothetical protein [candidate division KSB1 bacterium]NIR70803.1 hypothetical protein [candidate division KSB1 bacterium]NIS27816.1 hypothetical protein [candidate division KSB1 bacterium]NIT74698.1 hypothetical protein [candidate division KSB1 bacterium]NIU28483.1 hypothetical protein [candidate division KSB1 bacterium]
MKHIRLNLIPTIITLCVLGCGGVPPTYYYRIGLDDHRVEEQNNSTFIPVTLGIAQCTTDILYESDKIVYRDSPYEVQFYHYRRWIAPPKKLVTEKIFEQFRSSGYFRKVVSLPAKVELDYILKGRIEAFEEWDERNSWYGLVSVDFKLQNPKTREIVWEKTFSERTPAQKKEPVEVVKAISQSLYKVIGNALDEIKHNLRDYKI